MKNYFRTLQHKLEENLKQISYDYDDTAEMCDKSILEILDCLGALKSFVIENSFESIEDEIHFFKEFKPKITSKLIYHKKVKKLEIKTPTGTPEHIYEYYKEELQNLNYEYTRNREIYDYHRQKNAYLDHAIFVRHYDNVCPNVNPEYYDMDHRFATSHDNEIAKIIANAQFKDYVENKISALGKMVPVFSKPATEGFCLEWTGNIVDAAELVYGIHGTKTFNHGKATLAEIATWVTMGTDLKLKDLYGAYGEIKKRKSNVPRYVNSISKSLDERVERDNKKRK